MRSSLVSYVDPDQAFLAKLGVSGHSAASSLRLGDLFDVASGAYAPNYVQPTTPGAVPYLRVDNVRPYVPNLTDADVVWVLRPSGAEATRLTAKTGDVVIARTGTLGKAFVVPPELDGAMLSQHVTHISPKPGGSTGLAHGLNVYLNTQEGWEQAHALATGSTRLELTHEAIRSMRLPTWVTEFDESEARRIPTLFSKMRTEARLAIAACDALFGIVADQSRQYVSYLAHLDRKAMTRSLLPRFWHPELVANEASLTKAFHCEELGSFASVFRGAGTRSSDYSRIGIPYIRTSSLVNYGIDLLPDHYGSEELYRVQGQGVGPGDILVSMEGKIGMVALLTEGERCLVKNHIEVVRLRKDNGLLPSYLVEFPAFLFAFLWSSVGQAQLRRRTVTQATIPGLGSDSREILVPLGAHRAEDAARFARTLQKVELHVTASLAARAALRQVLASVNATIPG